MKSTVAQFIAAGVLLIAPAVSDDRTTRSADGQAAATQHAVGIQVGPVSIGVFACQGCWLV